MLENKKETLISEAPIVCQAVLSAFSICDPYNPAKSSDQHDEVTPWWPTTESDLNSGLLGLSSHTLLARLASGV